MKNSLAFIVLVLALVLSNGCMFDLTNVQYIKVDLIISSQIKPSWTLNSPTDVPLKSWSTTKLQAGTKWDYVGSLPQGDVYSTEDQIVTAVGSNTFEADLTIKKHEIVGLYLPVEKGFVTISKPVAVDRTFIGKD